MDWAIGKQCPIVVTRETKKVQAGLVDMRIVSYRRSPIGLISDRSTGNTLHYFLCPAGSLGEA